MTATAPLGDTRLTCISDFSIATYRFGFAESMFSSAPVVAAIERDGAILTVIRGPPARRGGA